MKTAPIVVFVAALSLVGCATTTPLATPSGRPEVTIKAPVGKVKSAAINYFVDLGWAPVKTEGSQLIFEHEGSTGEAFMMGLLTNNPQATNRITLTMVENGPSVRLVGGVATVGSNNFGKAQVVELTGKGYQQLQSMLETIKSRAELR